MALDILGIPLYYINFNKSDEIENHYKNYGFKNVNHFKAVNGKKMDLDKILGDGIITIRSYEDIVNGRVTHKGLTSMGAIGCTLSHYELWKKCIVGDLPFMVIVEADNRMSDKMTPKIKKKITDILSKNKSIFISVTLKQKLDKLHFFGTHFYIVTQSACKELVKHVFPIDVQTDWYMGHLARIKKINLEGFPISYQMNEYSGETSVQDSGCVLCIITDPHQSRIFFGVIGIIILLIILYLMRRRCRK